MSWSKEVEELRLRQNMAKGMGGPENIDRQHAKGRLTVRERLDILLDPDSFSEVGSIAGNAEYDDEGRIKALTHVARVNGTGLIDGRKVCVEGGDFTIRGGWADPTSFVSIGGFTPEKMALDLRIPMIRLLDSVGGSVERIEQQGHSLLLGNPERYMIPLKLMAHVPVISAALGSLGGYLPVDAASSHWSIMTKGSSELFVAGPPLIKEALGIEISKEDLGDYRVHAYKSGVIDNVAEDEKDVLNQIKRFLSYLPPNVWQQPPRAKSGDSPQRRDDELLSIIPKDRRKQYDVRNLIKHVVDKGSMFELCPYYWRSLVVALARLDSYPALVMANDCKWHGGAQTADACEKMMRYIDFADTFHLPIVYLVDCPGFMIGPESELAGIERKSARLAFAMAQLTVPGMAMIIRRSYGVAGGLHGSISHLNLRYAWPSAEWGSLPVEGGVMAAYHRQIEASNDPEAKRIEIENRLRELSSPFKTAEKFGVEEMIDPRDSRPIMCEFVRDAQAVTATQLGPKYRLGIRP